MVNSPIIVVQIFKTLLREYTKKIEEIMISIPEQEDIKLLREIKKLLLKLLQNGQNSQNEKQNIIKSLIEKLKKAEDEFSDELYEFLKTPLIEVNFQTPEISDPELVRNTPLYCILRAFQKSILDKNTPELAELSELLVILKNDTARREDFVREAIVHFVGQFVSEHDKRRDFSFVKLKEILKVRWRVIEAGKQTVEPDLIWYFGASNSNIAAPALKDLTKEYQMDNETFKLIQQNAEKLVPVNLDWYFGLTDASIVVQALNELTPMVLEAESNVRKYLESLKKQHNETTKLLQIIDAEIHLSENPLRLEGKYQEIFGFPVPLHLEFLFAKLYLFELREMKKSLEKILQSETPDAAPQQIMIAQQAKAAETAKRHYRAIQAAYTEPTQSYVEQPLSHKDQNQENKHQQEQKLSIEGEKTTEKLGNPPQTKR